MTNNGPDFGMNMRKHKPNFHGKRTQYDLFINNYGPNQYPEKLIPMTITMILDNKKAILHGDGSESREWIYVDDCVDAIYEIMEKGAIGEIYNVGSGIRMNNSIIMHNLISIITKAEDTQKYIEKVKNRPGNDNK